MSGMQDFWWWLPLKRWEENFTDGMLNTSRYHKVLGLPSEKEQEWIGWLEMQEFQGTVQWAVGWLAPPQPGTCFPTHPGSDGAGKPNVLP